MAKPTITASEKNIVSAPIMEVTQNLAGNLAHSAPLLRYRASEQKLNEDAEAQCLVGELSELQQTIRAQQYAGGITDCQLKRLRELQDAAKQNETIQESGLAQESAIEFLRMVNQEISMLVSIDFASLTRRSSGCC